MTSWLKFPLVPQDIFNKLQIKKQLNWKWMSLIVHGLNTGDTVFTNELIWYEIQYNKNYN